MTTKAPTAAILSTGVLSHHYYIYIGNIHYIMILLYSSEILLEKRTVQLCGKN